MTPFVRRAGRAGGSLLKRVSRRFIDYWKEIADNYWTVAKDTVVEGRKRKLRSALVLSGLGLAWHAIRTNPTMDAYRDRLALMQLSELIRNPDADRSITEKTSLLNQGRLSRLNLVLCSLILRNEYTDVASLYASQCPALKPKLIELPQRVVDVGAFGRWFLAERDMHEFDVNPEEFAEVAE